MATRQGGAAARAGQERYTHGYGTAVVAHMAQRTAEREAAFFLPHLRPGMRLLDLGCGPGAITLGLARAVAPGEVVGIDCEPSMVEQARALATERGVANVRFEVADATALPFPEGTFDAAFEHTLLEHVPDPVAVLRELRRVVKPGGVLGLRDVDVESRVTEPDTPLLEEAFGLYGRLMQHNGGHLTLGRWQRTLLRDAGIARAETSAGATTFGTPDATRAWAELRAGLLEGPRFAEQVIALGWTDRASIARWAQAIRAWGGHPDAVWAELVFQTVAWVT